MAARDRPGSRHRDTRKAIRCLARRWLTLNEEISAHNNDLDVLVKTAAPNLVAQFGISRDVAAKLLITAGDNPERIKTEAGFAALCGVNPIAASSGINDRHRLNRSGDRQANNALWTIAMVRLAHDPVTRAYAERRTKQRKKHREIVRCIKRYLARKLFAILIKTSVSIGVRCLLP
jgi:transposase